MEQEMRNHFSELAFPCSKNGPRYFNETVSQYVYEKLETWCDATRCLENRLFTVKVELLDFLENDGVNLP